MQLESIRGRPETSGEQLEESRREQGIHPPRQEHILVVNDDSSVLSVLVTLLEHSGFDVTAASCVPQALCHLQEDPGCDLVLADVLMPGADGLSLLDAIALDYPGVPVVMLTSLADVHVAVNAFRRGAVDYVLKPFDRTRLLDAIARALDRSRLLRQSAVYRHNLEEVVSARTHRLRTTLHDLEISHDVTLQVMGDALDLRDSGTEGHCRRVTAYTVALAREIGVKPDQLRVIARGAFLHDVGKIATPDSILHKPAALDPEETRIMRQHCAHGYEMVRKIPFLCEEPEIIYAHHETFDGTGYPRGLRGEAIPLGSRIFAIADTLDAITSDRPYRKARSYAEASAEILRCSGTQFDPNLVAAFLRIPESLWLDLRSEVERGASGIFGVPV